MRASRAGQPDPRNACLKRDEMRNWGRTCLVAFPRDAFAWCEFCAERKAEFNRGERRRYVRR